MGCGSAFAHAVASFDPTATSVLLWARLSGGHRQASWLVATDPALTEVVAQGRAGTGPEHDHTFVVEASGASADETDAVPAARAETEQIPAAAGAILSATDTDHLAAIGAADDRPKD